MRWPTIDRLSWRLGISIAFLVVLGQVVSFFLVYRYSSAQVLEAARTHATLETELVRQALEYQMLVKDDQLIRTMVESFGSEDAFRRVMILDREGQVRFSSDPLLREVRFQQSSPTCQGCHHQAALDRSHSVVLEDQGETLLRAVLPIPNNPACHRCHDPAHRINGLVVADLPLGEALRAMERTFTTLALSSSLLALFLLGGIGLVVRRLVLRRLVTFESAAKALARGELDRRVTVEGDDALTRVEEQFNLMADAIGTLLTELRQQRANLLRAMNSVDDGMVVLDRGRRIVAANDAFWRRFPGGVMDRVGCRCHGDGDGALGCGHEGSCPTVECFAQGTVQTAIRTRTLDDGSLRQDEVRASPVVDDEGRITSVVEVWRDITDRRSAEARLAEYQRMASVGMLASGFSHEINTPLASIGTCLDGIARVSAGAGPIEGERREQVEEYTRIAAAQVARCGAITEQFLQLARGRSLRGDVIDLQACAASTVRLSKHLAEAAGVQIVVEDRAGLPTVVANPAAAQQVILNLLLNAIEASQPGQRVDITFHEEKGRVLVQVQDQGRGIAAEDLHRVFEPFFTRRPKGTGLGLFVSMNLARGWDGDILVESVLGAGATFRVVFPREVAQGESAA